MRQPPRSASVPEAKRASRIPETTPLWMVPMVCPRSAGAASVAANATITWMTTASSPTSAIPPNSTTAFGAVPTTTSATADRAIWPTISLRRSQRSPSGTISISPKARPIWVSVTTMPIAAGVMPRSRAMVSSSGCAE